MKPKPQEWVKHCARGLAWVFGLKWVEIWARVVTWIFGMFLAIGGVLPLLKRQDAVILIILLYFFLISVTIVFVCDTKRVVQK